MQAGLVGISAAQVAELQRKSDAQLTVPCPLTNTSSIKSSVLLSASRLEVATKSTSYNPREAVRIATDPRILAQPRKTPEEIAPLLRPMVAPSERPDIPNLAYNCCANFVSAVLINAGANIKPTLSVSSLQAELEESGWTEVSQNNPRPGDVVIISKYDPATGDMVPSHTELVEGPGDLLVGSNDPTDKSGNLLPQVIGNDRISYETAAGYEVKVLRAPQ